MNLICLYYLVPAVISLASLSKLEDIKIKTVGDNVTFIWTTPPSTTKTELVLYKYINKELPVKIRDDIVKSTAQSYSAELQPCYLYEIWLRFMNETGVDRLATQIFWTGVSDKTFYTEMNADVNLTWKTTLTTFYNVNAPTKTIYTVKSLGRLIRNTSENKYKILTGREDQGIIGVTVLNVTEEDVGIYTTVDERNRQRIECCRLVIRDPPAKLLSYTFIEGQQADITVNIDSNPDPVFLFHYANGTVTKLLATREHNSTHYNVSLPRLKCEESGVYIIEADNRIRESFNISLQLEIKCKPYNVQNITFYDITTSSTSMFWIARGDKQRFFVELQLVHGGYRTENVSSLNTHEGSVIFHTILGLTADTEYNGAVIAQNRYGETSTEFRFQTKVENEGFTKCEIITYSVSGTLFVVLVVIFILLLKCRRKYKGKGKDEYRSLTRQNETERLSTTNENAYDDLAEQDGSIENSYIHPKSREDTMEKDTCKKKSVDECPFGDIPEQGGDNQDWYLSIIPDQDVKADSEDNNRVQKHLCNHVQGQDRYLCPISDGDSETDSAADENLYSYIEEQSSKDDDGFIHPVTDQDSKINRVGLQNGKGNYQQYAKPRLKKNEEKKMYSTSDENKEQAFNNQQNAASR